MRHIVLPGLFSAALTFTPGPAQDATPVAAPTAGGRQVRVLVLPFDNTSSVTQHVARQVVPNTTGIVRVDALAELCRTGVEETLVTAGLTVVERERVSSCLEEMEFTGTGLVDPRKVAEAGRLLGATLIVTGSIRSIRDQITKIGAYRLGVQRRTIEVDLQVSVLAIESGTKVFLRTLTGRAAIDANKFRQENVTNLEHDAVRDALSQLERDPKFVATCRRGGPDPEDVDVTLTLTSEPAGADVFVDGDLHGQTPIAISGKAGAVLDLSVRRAGYEVWQAKTRLDPKKPATLRIELAKK